MKRVKKLNRENVKTIVRKRDGCCTECGMTAEQHRIEFGRTLDVHRVVPNSKYTLEGCVALCRPCHRKKPHKPKHEPHYYPVLRMLRIPEALRARLQKVAFRNARPVNWEGRIALEKHIAAEEKRLGINQEANGAP